MSCRVTTIVNVLTMLNAATNTMSNRMSLIPSFSSLRAPETRLRSALANSPFDKEYAAFFDLLPESLRPIRFGFCTSIPVTAGANPASSCDDREARRYM